jgi:16S rRNA (adenine1518-N6/adenine1519-N6)-dimethyltransferase
MRPKRSLGQNFLKNVGIAEKMASLADIGRQDTVVEIGPGRGILTRVLLKYTSEVIAIEKDDNLFEQLGMGLKDFSGLQLVHQDILESDLERLIPDGAKIVSNLPYNIATQLIMRLVNHAGRIQSVVVMIQKEVGQRICAQVGDKNYSLLSVIVSAGFDASPGFIVGPNNFFPPPKVDSQVIKLIPKSAPIPRSDMEVFWRVVAKAFGQRRKTLRNTLSQLPSMDDEILGTLSSYAGIDLGQRPQEITPEHYHLFSRGYEELLRGRTLIQGV